MFPLSAQRALRSVADAAAAVTVALFAVLGLLLLRRRHLPAGRELLVLDSSYTVAAVRARGLEQAVRARDVGGWFDHVWSVHPLVGADEQEGAEHGGLDRHELTDRHTVLEAHVGRSRRLVSWPMLNLALSQAQLVAELRRLLAARPIVAVRVGDPYYLGLLGLALARAARIPLVIRVNGNHDAIYDDIGALAYPRLFRRRSIEKRIDHYVLSRAALVMAPSDDNLQFALKNGAVPGRSAVVHYGSLIHPAHFSDPNDRSGEREFLPDGPIVVAVTRLEPVKRPGDVVAAVDAIRRHLPDVVAVIAGDGSLRAPLEDEIERRGLRGRVLLPGNLDQERLAALLAGADVVLAPSMGRALVEASLSATPVVAYDVDWHRELVADGITGLLVPGGDVEAMAAATVRLLGDRRWADRLGAAAREHALERMAPARLEAHERTLYEQVLGVSVLRR